MLFTMSPLDAEYFEKKKHKKRNIFVRNANMKERITTNTLNLHRSNMKMPTLSTALGSSHSKNTKHLACITRTKAQTENANIVHSSRMLHSKQITTSKNQFHALSHSHTEDDIVVENTLNNIVIVQDTNTSKRERD